MSPEQTENSPQFHDRMRQSMTVSFHKYGPVREAFPHKVNAIRSLKQRLALYEKTGNADYLVDIANFAMIEFMLPAHPLSHDTPTDGGEGRCWQAGGRANEKRNDGERL
jgi:hypothetical protein